MVDPEHSSRHVSEVTDDTAELLARILKTVKTLENSLDVSGAETLYSLAYDLRNICKSREAIQTAILEWKKRNSGSIKRCTEIHKRLRSIDNYTNRNLLQEDSLKTLLDNCEAALTATVAHQDAHHNLERALQNQNYKELSSLSSQATILMQEAHDLFETLDRLIDTLHKYSINASTNPISESQTKVDESGSTDDVSDPDTDPVQSSTSARHDSDTQSTDTEPIRSNINTLESQQTSRLDPHDDHRDAPTSLTPDGALPKVTEISTAVRDYPSDRYKQIDDKTSEERTLPNDNPTHLSEEEHDSLDELANYIESALGKRRYSIAYHLAGIQSLVWPSQEIIELIAMNYVTDDIAAVYGDLPALATTLQKQATTLIPNFDHTESVLRYSVLLSTAALRPSLTATGVPVAQLIDYLVPHLDEVPSLQGIAKQVSRIALIGIHIPMDKPLNSVPAHNWSEEIESLRSETDTWVAAQQQSHLKARVATRVWHKMLQSNRSSGHPSLGEILISLSETDDPTDLNDIVNIITRWQANSNKEIDRIDRSLRLVNKNRSIDGAARADLRKKIVEASALAERWKDLIHSKPKEIPGFQESLEKKLADTIKSFGESAIAEIRQLQLPNGQCAIDLVARFNSILDIERQATSRPLLNLQHLLHGDLLTIENVAFDKNDLPTSLPSKVALLSLLDADPEKFEAAAVHQIQTGNFQRAYKTIDFAVRSQILETDSVTANWQDTIDQNRELFVSSLIERSRRVQSELDSTYAVGAIDATELHKLQARLPSTDPTLYSQNLDFRSHLTDIDEVHQEIKKAKNDLANGMHNRLPALPKISPRDRKRIQDLIDNERFVVAEEFLDCLENGNKIPDEYAGPRSAFADFFPTFVDYYGELRQTTPDILVQLQRGEEHSNSTQTVNLTRSSVGLSLRHSNLIENWIALRNRPNPPWKRVQSFLRSLGFSDISNKPEISSTSEAEQPIKIRVRPIADRQISQLPDFGSLANGRYTVLIVRDRHTASAVTQVAGPWKPQQPPTILIFMGLLDSGERRILATATHSATYHPTLVIDEALMAYIATSARDELATFFSCASPFAYANPYDPDSTVVPPEMFFGRKAERRRIIATTGDITHLVYGGRRLGKTALFSDIARNETTKDKNTIVSMINLRGTGIGENLPPEYIWREFARILVNEGLLNPNATRPVTIAKSTKNWLNGNTGRQVLFLIDEADSFLEADRQDKNGQMYREVERIKRLMEDTQRRFKVVFAGLHNVQRVARDPNTPIAHLGSPVKIGPMLPENREDRGEIERLIQAPLEAMGFRFQSFDSVIRIAAETNYYPALAQQYCKELLAELRSSVVNEREGPPYSISSSAVDRVFSSRESRDRIRNLFNWTIELDPRYEFLTYLIAFHSFDTHDGRRVYDVPISQIRDESLRDWPNGFASDRSYAMFESLLEEMIGLGILRQTQNDGETCFAIRSRNLKRLLGQKDQIERRLIDATYKEPAPGFIASQFRQTLGSINSRTRKPSNRLCCLTAGQENALLSRHKMVAFIFGTTLAGVDRLYESSKHLVKRVNRDSIDSEFRITLDRVNPSSLIEALAMLKRRKQRSSVIEMSMLLVDIGDQWPSDKIQFAVKTVSRLAGRNRIIRPVFIGGPTPAWKWVCGAQSMDSMNTEIREMWLGPCARDFTRRWLREHAGKTCKDLENFNNPADSLWPVVVETASHQNDITTIAGATGRAIGDGSLIVDDVLSIPPVDQLLKDLLLFKSEEIDYDGLCDLVEDYGDFGIFASAEEWMPRVLEWAGNLGIILNRGERYRLDSAWASGLDYSRK